LDIYFEQCRILVEEALKFGYVLEQHDGIWYVVERKDGDLILDHRCFIGR
jgi:hypothetical protein